MRRRLLGLPGFFTNRRGKLLGDVLGWMMSCANSFFAWATISLASAGPTGHGGTKRGLEVLRMKDASSSLIRPILASLVLQRPFFPTARRMFRARRLCTASPHSALRTISCSTPSNSACVGGESEYRASIASSSAFSSMEPNASES